ncbi:MAG TPA: DUF4411 family protein [Polyangia bacterium]|jgi:hypothetical protein|nr:DUF4411 family protein [Polyangia bacterium]
MTDSTGVIYSIDTSSLMDWQARYYPIDVFVGLPPQVDSLGTTGRLLAVALVEEEVRVIGTADMAKWLKDRKDIIVPTAAVLAEAQAIQNQFTGLRDPKAEFEEADPYVIALAKQRNGIVVTQETPAAEKRNPKRTHFIPDVCRELGIPCISLIGLMRREGWRF